MNLDRLMWVFAGLAVVFGLLLAVVDSPTARNFWGSLSLISLCGFAFAMIFNGVSKGEIRLQFNVIRRATQPRLFWATVALIAAAGIGVIISAVRILFFEQR